MHLQSNLNLVARLESVHIISELFSIRMLLEQRSNRRMLLTSMITFLARTILILSHRNPLTADFMPINHANSSARMEDRLIHTKIRQARNRQIKTIRLLTAQTNCSYVTLDGVHIATNIITIFILTTDQVIGCTELFRELQIGREINTNIAHLHGQVNTGIIAEKRSNLHTVGIRMGTELFHLYNITTMFRHFYYLI